MSMFLRYNLVNEEDVAGMKWKDTDRDIQSISGSLKDIGFNPDVVLESLLLERGQNNKLGAYQKLGTMDTYMDTISNPLFYQIL